MISYYIWRQNENSTIVMPISRKSEQIISIEVTTPHQNLRMFVLQKWGERECVFVCEK